MTVLEISPDDVEKGILDKTDYRLDLKFYSPTLKKSYGRLASSPHSRRLIKDLVDQVPTGFKIDEETEYKYLQIGDIDGELGEISEYSTMLGKELPSRAQILLSKNDVVVSSVRPLLREIAIVPEDLDKQIGTNGLIVLRCKGRKDIDPEYLFYTLRSGPVTDELDRRSGALNYPAISDHDLLYLEIPYPEDDKVREALVKQFRAATGRVKSIKETINKLLLERNNILAASLRTAEMTKIDPNVIYTVDEAENNEYRIDVKFYRYSRKHPYGHLALDTVDNLGTFQDLKVNLTKSSDDEFVQVTASRDKGIIFRGKKIGRDIKTKTQRRVKIDDLVISRIDLYNGCLGIVPPDLDDAIVTRDFMVLRPNKDKVNPVYFTAVLKDEYMSDYFYAFCAGATGRKRITEEVFKTLKVPTIDRTEQDRIRDVIITKDLEIQKLRREAALVYKTAEVDFLTALGVPAVLP